MTADDGFIEGIGSEPGGKAVLALTGTLFASTRTWDENLSATTELMASDSWFAYLLMGSARPHHDL